MKILNIAAAVVAGLAAVTSAHATQFVTDGNFTSLSAGVGQIGYNTVAAGWSTATNGYNFVMATGTAGANGQYGKVALWDGANGGASTWNGLGPIIGNFAALNGDFQTEALTQTITGLTVGKTYTLSFDYAFAQQSGFNGATSQALTASLGGAKVFTSATDSLPSHGFSGWETYSGTLVATSSTEVLSFLAETTPQVPGMALLTGVSLTGAVPEPASWAMMLVGFGAMGLAARRRRLTLAVG